MTVATALAEATHHAAPRGPKTARAQEEVERETCNVPQHQKTPPPGAPPARAAGPQARFQRHTVEQISDTIVPVSILDAAAVGAPRGRAIALLRLVRFGDAEGEVLGSGQRGHAWFQVSGPRGSAGGCRAHDMSSGISPEGITVSSGWQVNTGKDDDVPVIMHLSSNSPSCSCFRPRFSSLTGVCKDVISTFPYIQQSLFSTLCC